MWGFMWKMGQVMVDAFIPGVGKTQLPVEEVPQIRETEQGIKITTGNSYKSVSSIVNRRANKVCKPFFFISKSKIWRKRAARILYGKEDEDYFL